MGKTMPLETSSKWVLAGLPEGTELIDASCYPYFNESPGGRAYTPVKASIDGGH